LKCLLVEELAAVLSLFCSRAAAIFGIVVESLERTIELSDDGAVKVFVIYAK
jgi:hypothetical protein